MVPYFYLPLVNIAMHATWKLAGGRNPLFHHAFPILDQLLPVPAPLLPGEARIEVKRQVVLDVPAMIRAEGLALGMDVAFSSGGSVRRVKLLDSELLAPHVPVGARHRSCWTSQQ